MVGMIHTDRQREMDGLGSSAWLVAKRNREWLRQNLCAKLVSLGLRPAGKGHEYPGAELTEKWKMTQQVRGNEARKTMPAGNNREFMARSRAETEVRHGREVGVVRRGWAIIAMSRSRRGTPCFLLRVPSTAAAVRMRVGRGWWLVHRAGAAGSTLLSAISVTGSGTQTSGTTR